MSTDEMICSLVAATMINYPLLRKTKHAISKPLALIFESLEEFNEFCDGYPLTLNVIDTTASFRKARKLLTDITADQSVFLFTSSARLTDESFKKLQLLIDAAATGRTDSKSIYSMPVAIFIKALPLELESAFFSIYVPAVKMDLRLVEYLPHSSELGYVFKNIEEIRADIAGCLLAAVECLRFGFIRENRSDDVDMLREMVHVLADQNENRADLGGLCEVFVREAFSWRDEEKHSFLRKETINIEAFNTGCIIFDADYVYISKDNMNDIMARLRNAFSVDVIKQTLRDKGYLICSKRTEYTQKITIGGLRKRVYVFDSQKLEDINGMPFVKHS